MHRSPRQRGNGGNSERNSISWHGGIGGVAEEMWHSWTLFRHCRGWWGRWEGTPVSPPFQECSHFDPGARTAQPLAGATLASSHRRFRHFTDEEPEACGGSAPQRAAAGQVEPAGPRSAGGWPAEVGGGSQGGSEGGTPGPRPVRQEGQGWAWAMGRDDRPGLLTPLSYACFSESPPGPRGN